MPFLVLPVRNLVCSLYVFSGVSGDPKYGDGGGAVGEGGASFRCRRR